MNVSIVYESKAGVDVPFHNAHTYVASRRYARVSEL